MSDVSNLAILEMFQKIMAEIEILKGNLPKPVKEWYSTEELAEALGKKPFTIREKWCNAGRIACEKCEISGKWRIPAAEYQRLVAGGAKLPK